MRHFTLLLHLLRRSLSPPCPRPPAHLPPPRFWQDHGVFARHNKFGTFQVPKTFLNFNEAAEQCALKVAEKQAAKGAAKKAAKHAVATQTNQKTELTKTNQAETGQETTYQKATKKAVTDEAPTVTARVLPVKSTKEEGAACEQPAGPAVLGDRVPPPTPHRPAGLFGHEARASRKATQAACQVHE